MSPIPSHLLVFLAFVALAVTGCRTVKLDSAGELRAAYNYGEFSMLLNNTAPATAKAAEAAFRDLDLFLVRKKINTYDAELAARTRADVLVKVSIREVNSRQTQLDIRVGTTGDLKLSRALYERIERHLGGTR